MTYMIARCARNPLSGGTLLLEIARCWRGARDAGKPVQPCLFAALRAHGCTILAPVFDSLMRLCESALGRRLDVGARDAISEDEALLLDLLAGARRARACFACDEGLLCALDCAVYSTRIMLHLADGDPRLAS